MLPDTQAPALPQYAETPEYLDPEHCRLCLQPYEDTGLERHLREQHQISLEEYRQRAFRRTLTEWPQPISPQILRSRLAAFKRELSDFNFLMLSCAVCARQKRRCKLTAATFPPKNATSAPAWLPWDDNQWMTHRNSWFDQVDSLLCIDTYLEKFFLTKERLEEAEKEVKDFDDGESSFATVDAAKSWVRRVRCWVDNLRRDLVEDSVPAPSGGNRWLLFHRSPEMSIDSETGAISCHLCKSCLKALSKVEAASGKKPDVRMPMYARANGLWRGPDPQELAGLSYAETKVINLAKLYVSVKRVFLDRGSYAATSKSEAPLYHQKNVVAYPQNPDAALCAMGLTPESLARTLLVQFVGEDRERLRTEPELSVSVEKLRKAFVWLSVNSWPFMEKTRDHEQWQHGALAEPLEELLRS